MNLDFCPMTMININIIMFFDIDGDNAPELTIRDHASFVYTIDYDETADEFKLWQDYDLKIIGTRKLAVISLPLYSLFNLDQYGEVDQVIRFERQEYTNSCSGERECCYLVMLPYSWQHESAELPQALKEKAFWNEEAEQYAFRVTEEQYNELTKDFFASSKSSSAQLDKVTYTYDELFGGNGRVGLFCSNHRK